MQRFLIMQTAFIGDVVLATALAEKIHAYYPEATLDFLLRKGNEPLLHQHPFIRKVWVWDKTKSKNSNLMKLAMKVRKEHYTHVINPHRFASSGILCYFSGAEYISGFDRNPLSQFYTHRLPYVSSAPYTEAPVHEVQRNHQLIAPITDDVPAHPRLYPTPEDYQKIKRYQTEKYLCLAPSSVWYTKQYPVHKWIELLRALDENIRVYLLGGGGAETALAQEICTQVPRKNCINLSGQLSFLQSAALMQGAVMNYVNDSAPLHFCSALNAKVTALFCSTVPAFGFTPLSDESKVIEVPERLPCRPCGLHGKATCPEGHFHCAEKIKVEQLLWWT